MSLFYVMAAMVECSIVLAIKRLHDKQFCCQQQEVINCNQVLIISEENRNHKRIGNDNLDMASNNINGPITNKQLNGPSTLSSFCSAAELRTRNIGNVGNVRLDEKFTWTYFIPSPNTIDIMALILFPTFYILFNVFYWELIM